MQAPLASPVLFSFLPQHSTLVNVSELGGRELKLASVGLIRSGPKPTCRRQARAVVSFWFVQAAIARDARELSLVRLLSASQKVRRIALATERALASITSKCEILNTTKGRAVRSVRLLKNEREAKVKWIGEP